MFCDETILLRLKVILPNYLAYTTLVNACVALLNFTADVFENLRCNSSELEGDDGVLCNLPDV